MEKAAEDPPVPGCLTDDPLPHPQPSVVACLSFAVSTLNLCQNFGCMLGSACLSISFGDGDQTVDA